VSGRIVGEGKSERKSVAVLAEIEAAYKTKKAVIEPSRASRASQTMDNIPIVGRVGTPVTYVRFPYKVDIGLEGLPAAKTGIDTLTLDLNPQFLRRDQFTPRK
jgi:hypothetical protein